MDLSQYIFLQCLNISQPEWHPFTLTSCPGEDFLSVHSRIVGDCAKKLAHLCEHDYSSKSLFGGGRAVWAASLDVFRVTVSVGHTWSQRHRDVLR